MVLHLQRFVSNAHSLFLIITPPICETGDSMKLMICPDLDEPFLPDYEGLMNRINNSTEAIQDFLQQLPETFTNTNDVGNCLGSVLQVSCWVTYCKPTSFIVCPSHGVDKRN